MKKLKMKSLKSILWVVIFIWVIAAVLGGPYINGFLKSFQKPIPLESVDFAGDIEGLYVTGTIYGIYDYYCEETKDYKLVAREYIIDAGDSYYMGMRAEGTKDMDNADKLMETSWDFLDYVAEYEELEAVQYEVTGTISKIPSDSRVYYYEYRDWIGTDAETQAMFLPYYLEVNHIDGNDKTTIYALVIISALLVLFSIGMIIWALTGSYQKVIKKYIQNSASPDMAQEKVERFLENTPEKKGLRYNNEFICGQSGASTAFGETSKLAWVYLHTTTHKRYFITISTTYELMLCFSNGTRQSVGMKSEAIARGHMEDLSKICPQTIFGYSDELERLFSRNLNEFLNLRFNNAQVANL